MTVRGPGFLALGPWFSPKTASRIVVLTHNRVGLLRKCVENVLLQHLRRDPRDRDLGQRRPRTGRPSTSRRSTIRASRSSAARRNVGHNGYARGFRETTSAYLVELDDDMVERPGGVGRDAARRVRAGSPAIGYLAADLEDDPHDEASRYRYDIRAARVHARRGERRPPAHRPGRRRLRDDLARGERSSSAASRSARTRSSGSRTAPTSRTSSASASARRCWRTSRSTTPAVRTTPRRQRRKPSSGGDTTRCARAVTPPSAARARPVRPPPQRALRLVRRPVLTGAAAVTPSSSSAIAATERARS